MTVEVESFYYRFSRSTGFAQLAEQNRALIASIVSRPQLTQP